MRATALVLIGLLVSALGLGFAPAEEPTAFVLGDESRLWIEGTSTVRDFTCEALQVAGVGTVETGEAATADLDAVVAVAVRAFDCGVSQMNRDFYDALKARQHPGIRVVLTRAQVLAPPTDEAWADLRVWGTITLAGTRRAVEVTAQGRRLPDGRVQVRGGHTLHMTDFGIEPPSGLLGLVRAHDKITVRFDLVADAN